MLLPPEPLGKGIPDLHYFLLGDNAFALMPWMVKPYSARELTREERIANYRISRGRWVVENVFGILVSRFLVLLCTMEQRSKVVRDIGFMCVVQDAEDTPGQADRAPTQTNDVAEIQNEQVAYVPDDNYRNQGRTNISWYLSVLTRFNQLLNKTFIKAGVASPISPKINLTISNRF